MLQYLDYYTACAHQKSQPTLKCYNFSNFWSRDTLKCLQFFDAVIARQEGHPACKKLSGEVLAWLSVWSKVQAQLMPLLLTVSCSNKIQIGFTFLVPAYPGSLGKRDYPGKPLPER